MAALLATVVIGIALLWTAAATLRDGFLPSEYPVWQFKRRMIAECRLPATVIMGDSRAVAGFVPGRIPDTINLALGGATPIELYYTARRILACPRAPRRVILSVSIPQLTGADYFWQRSALFGFLSFDELEQVRKRSRALHDDTLFASPTVGDADAILTDWLYAHHFPSYATAYLLNEGVIGRLRDNHRVGAAVARSGGQHLYGTSPGSDGVSNDGSGGQLRVARILDEYLRRMIVSFAERGSQVVFMAAPMNAATYGSIPPTTVLALQHYLAGLALRYSNFQVIGDPLPHWDNKWFGDPTHMNAAGADLFSAQVAQELAALPR